MNPITVSSSVHEKQGRGQRLRLLVAFRLATAVALFAATWFFRPGVEGSLFGRSFLAILIITSSHLFVALTLVFRYFGRPLRSFSRLTFLQIVWDLLFNTALVGISGGIDSPFKIMYYFTIFNAALLFLGTGAFSAAALSGIFYGALANLEYLKHMPQFFDVVRKPGTWQENQVIASIVLNTIGFFVVAYFSSYLSVREERAEVKLAQKSLEIENLEALMKRIVESLTSGLATLDSMGRINFWNGPAQEITKLNFKDIHLKPFLEIFPDASAQFDQNGELLPGEARPWRLETQFQCPNGEEKILGFSLASLRHGTEASQGSLVIFQDLTRYREMEEKVKRADQLAAVGELAARIAHEIRNPLTSLSGAIEVLKNQLALEKQDQKLMDIAVRETDRLSQLLTDFLLFAKPMSPQLEEVEVRNLIQEASELFSRSHGNKKISLKLNLKVSTFLWADSRQLSQMMWNLMTNAADSMPQGGEIEINLMEDIGKREVIVEVRDEGIGIPHEIREKIFHPFYTTKTRGTGLGLAVVRRIVEDHGGSISFESLQGGTIFRVRFPKTLKENQLRMGVA